jgi:hypothetical protein
MASDITGIVATGVVAVLVAGIGAFSTTEVANIETSRKQLEYQMKRRSERQETYQTVIDLLSDFGWRAGADRKFDVIRDFNMPFLHAANRVRVYGSPGTISAIDEIQLAFQMTNRAKSDAEREAAVRAMETGRDHLVMAAREDVGPRPEDGLKDVHFNPGAGPPAQ